MNISLPKCVCVHIFVCLFVRVYIHIVLSMFSISVRSLMCLSMSHFSMAHIERGLHIVLGNNESDGANRLILRQP